MSGPSQGSDVAGARFDTRARVFHVSFSDPGIRRRRRAVYRRLCGTASRAADHGHDLPRHVVALGFRAPEHPQLALARQRDLDAVVGLEPDRIAGARQSFAGLRLDVGDVVETSALAGDTPGPRAPDGQATGPAIER